MTFTLDSAGNVFYAAFALSRDALPAITSAQLRTVAMDASTSATITYLGQAFRPASKGVRAVQAGENASILIAGLNSSAGYWSVVVAEDSPGGPNGPNLQAAVSKQYVVTVGLSLTMTRVNAAEGGGPANYGIEFTGIEQGELRHSTLLAHFKQPSLQSCFERLLRVPYNNRPICRPV